MLKQKNPVQAPAYATVSQFVVSLSTADVPAEEGFLCDTIAVLGETIKKSNWYYFKVKGKGHPRTGHDSHEE
jgi:hypothetical protein